jgi:apolipoprotein N-acyltransferase
MNWKLATGGGMLLGTGFVAPQLWPLVFFGFVPLIEGIRQARSLGQTFLFGWLAGSVLYGLGCFGIWWQTLPLDWLGFFDLWFQVLLIAVSWALTAAGLALFVGMFAVMFKYLSDNTWWDFIYFASAWVVCEWLSAWWFSIQNVGPHTIVGPDFSLASVGNLLSGDEVLLQVAWLGGVYALSALAALVGMLLYRISRADRRERIVAVWICSAFVMLLLVGHIVLPRTPSDDPGAVPIRVAAISLQKPPIFVPTPAQDLTQYSVVMRLLPGTAGADIVALPETSDFLRTLRSVHGGAARSTISGIYAGGTIPTLIDSESVFVEGTLRDRMEFYNVQDGTAQFQNKRFLLPGGEYIPYLYRSFFAVLGQGSHLKEVLAHRGFTAGASPSPVIVNGISVGVLFCDETMSPRLYSSLARNGAQIFVNTASHSWFHGSRIVAAQMEGIAKVRAVESRRWYVQANDVAPSFVLDPYGRVVARSVWGREEVIVTDVYERTDKTPYVRFGMWIPSTLILLLFAVILRKRAVSMIR